MADLYRINEDFDMDGYCFLELADDRITFPGYFVPRGHTSGRAFFRRTNGDITYHNWSIPFPPYDCENFEEINDSGEAI